MIAITAYLPTSFLPELTIISSFITINSYFLYYKAQTLGKAICGMMVVNVVDRQISGNHYIFVRLLPLLLVLYLPVIGLSILFLDGLCIFRAEKNCLHDDIADTRVVTKKSFEQKYFNE